MFHSNQVKSTCKSHEFPVCHASTPLCLLLLTDIYQESALHIEEEVRLLNPARSAVVALIMQCTKINYCKYNSPISKSIVTGNQFRTRPMQSA
jgi:hypothetical protein